MADGSTSRRSTNLRPAGLGPWQMVIGLGFVSLATDMVSDGAISVGGVLLQQLGATAVLVGVVTGGADALALILRLATGPWVDRTGAYWTFTIVGYAMSAISVPLLALTPLLGAAGLAVASGLLLLERAGKAVRAPAKTVILAEPASAVGLGKGFGVHKVLDQIGAFSGPLIVAGVTAVTGALWPAFVVLIIPAGVAMALLLWLRAKVPDPSVFRRLPAGDGGVPSVGGAAPAGTATADGGLAARDVAPGEVSRPVAPERRSTIVSFAAFTALTQFGLLSFGVISYHLVEADLVPLAAAPLVFALAMAAGAVSAALTGWVYDARGPSVLLAVPVLTALVPALVFAPTLTPVLVGVTLWGAASGIQDSTVKALVADLVVPARRGSMYGWISVCQGSGAFAGATLAGFLYGSLSALVGIVVALQAAALVLLVIVLRRRRHDGVAPQPPVTA